jgi:3-hydroxyisobutyrate dehydrogenase-like beta-hydroxyacid dehydrogenase
MTTNRLRIGFIGFGEVGQTFSRGLLGSGKVEIAAWDVKFRDASGAGNLAAAATLGVRAATSAAEAARDAAILFSAVTASEAENVAREAAGYLRPGQMFVDVNSAAPTTKIRAAEAVGGAGGDYIEAAVMAPVLAPGIRVPILSGGPKAAEASALLNDLGMNLTAVSESYGRASAMKLCRSIIIKGLEALMVDCTAASEAWGVKGEVFASLAASYPSIDWHAMSENMLERVATHGVRRSAEMAEAADMVDALGLHPGLALAVADAQLRGAKPKD